MTELELIVDLHKDAERQGPGSKQETLKALEFTGLSKSKNLKIADIGCGTGTPTIHLAQHTQADITGVDIFPEFLNKLDKKATELGLQNRVSTHKASMDNLPFKEGQFDIIWSEGAIYNMGFEAGVRDWRRFIKPGGYLCVSEVTWITDQRPKKIEEFWQQEYPEIDKASNKIRFLEENGFTLAGYFYLTEDSWVKNYYNPMNARFTPFLERHNHSDRAKRLVEVHRAEIEQYHTYKEFYSYGFYVARKN
jgi:ubiquinone/menaquinone biosynthesis C-methylase UbiE